MKNAVIGAIGMMRMESIIPFLFPRQLRDALRDAFIRITRFPDRRIRFFGLMAILSGILPLLVFNLFS